MAGAPSELLRIEEAFVRLGKESAWPQGYALVLLLKGEFMKKALFFAALGLVLPLAWSQPALATGRISVHNATSYSVKVDIVYISYLCRDDHPTIAPNGVFSVNTGLCHIKHLTVTGRDGKCGPGVSSLGAPLFQIIEKKYPPHCEVIGRS